MDFKIELRNHVGERKDRNGKIVEVDFDQYRIFVIGDTEMQAARGKTEELLGYVSKKPGLPICYLPVATVYGRSTLDAFTQMVRTGLMEKLREQIEEAKKSIEEAKRLKAEADEMAEQRLELEQERMLVDQASRMATAAINESDEKLRKAMAAASEEMTKVRVASEPTFELLKKDPAKLAVDSKDSQSEAEIANSQNL